MYWWSRNGLIGDPFDRISGIEEIDIQSLIVETEIVRKYNNILVTDPRNLLGKSIIIFGEFGSGRTTLFSFLKGLIHREGIDSNIIRLHGSFEDSSEIEKKFLNSLFFKLTGTVREDVSLLEIIEELRNRKNKIDKYFIFIDELHKNQFIQSSLEFLKNLQGIIEEINEEVNIGIMIAGRNEWRNEIINNPIYSGTFANYDEIGEMSIEDACNMVDKRIRYFHSKPETYISFSLVNQDAIAKIYSTVEIKTPRAILRAVSRLVEAVPASVNAITSSDIPRYIGKNILSGIRNQILAVSSVYNRLSNVETLGDKDTQEKAFHLIYKIYTQPLKLPLNSSSGYDSELVIKMLRNNLLQKKQIKIPIVFDHIHVKSNEGNENVIVVDDAIKSVFDNITEKYQVSPEDYLFTIFLNKEKYTQSPQDDAKSIIKRIGSIKERLPERLEVCKTWIDDSIMQYSKVTNFEINGIPKEKEYEFLLTCESAMDGILKVYYAIREDITDTVNRTIFLEKILQDCDLEELSEFYQKVRISKDSETIHLDIRETIIDLFFRAYRKVVEIILGELDLGRFLALKSNYILPKEMEILRDIRSKIFDQKNYIKARSMIQILFKEKVAEFLNFNLSVVYGIDWYEKCLPGDLASKIKQEGSRIEERNPLQEKERIYKKLKQLDLIDVYEIIELKSLWDGIFGFVFGREYNKIYLKRIFNDIIDHLAEDEGKINHKSILNLVDRVLKLLVLMNRSMEFYLHKEQVVLLSSTPEESRILFGTKQMEKNDIKITRKEIDELEFLIKTNIRDSKFKVNRPSTPIQVGLFGYFVLKNKIVFSRCEGDKLSFEISQNFTKIIYKHRLKWRGGKCELYIANPRKDELMIQLSKPSDVTRNAPEIISLDESKIEDIFEEIERLSNYSDELFELSKETITLKKEDSSITKKEREYNSSLVKLGGAIYNLVLKAEIRGDLESCDLPINFVIDEKLMVYPWELMFDGTKFLALKSLVGRTIILNKKNSTPLKGWSRDGNIRFLIIGVSKPKNEESLPWVKIEIDKLKKILSQYPYIDLEVLLDEKATHTEVVRKLGESYDFIHFAGHAFYNEQAPEKSGLILYDKTLEAREIKMIIKTPPCLVFLNGCSSAKLDKNLIKSKYANFVQSNLFAFIEKGSSAIGSIWPVDDGSAAEFCVEFYQKFFENKEFGEAIRLAKRKIYETSKGNLAWASYVLYGDPCGYLETVPT